MEQIRLKKIRELKQTYDYVLENRKRMQQAENIMDEEENEEIRVYAAAKKKMSNLKHQKETVSLQ